MAFSNLLVFGVALLLLLPISPKGDDFPPVLSPYLDKVCNGAECGKGKCKPAWGYPFNFVCECEDGWKRTRLDDETGLLFLPCTIPNCSLDYSCMPDATPAPTFPYNLSFLDPCYWIYCGDGKCTRNGPYATHTCQCNPGYQNLLDNAVFPCYGECALGYDCKRLGINVTKSSSTTHKGELQSGTSTPTPSDDKNQESSSGTVIPTSSGNSNHATSLLPRLFHWIAILLISSATAQWK